MKSERLRNSFMEEKCEQAGCSQEAKEKHVYRYLKDRWDSHPPPKFEAWFLPIGRDASGASIGGHYEARHTVAKKVREGYEYLEEGISAASAWNTRRLRLEYVAWIAVGEPPAHGEFHNYVWLAAPETVIRQRLTELKATLAKIGLPIAKVTPQELQDEAARAGQRRALIDVEDLPEAEKAKPERKKTDDTREKEPPEPIDFA